MAIDDYLQDKSIYWNDDISIVETFTLKTIKQFEKAAGSKQKLLPMFKDLEDQSFAIKLFRQSLMKGSEFRERINKHMKNWETERIANMDLIIMQVALAEIMTFPTIPINVTLNEYIDTASIQTLIFPREEHNAEGLPFPYLRTYRAALQTAQIYPT